MTYPGRTAGRRLLTGLGAAGAVAFGWLLGGGPEADPVVRTQPPVLAADGDGDDPRATARTWIVDAAVASLAVRRPEVAADPSGRAAQTPRVGGCRDDQVPGAALGRLRAERALLCLINRQRRLAGARPVRTSFRLRRAARKHADDMVRRRYFRHDSLDGRNFAQRILSEDYASAARESYFLGENLAWGAKDRGTPASIVAAWMSSPPHRVNLLDPRFREVGVGAVVGGPQPTAEQAITVATTYGVRRR